MSPSSPTYRFEVALSFAGDGKRDLVRSVAELLRGELGDGKVFFDQWFEHELAGDNAQLVLQKIYRRSTRLVVSCICKRYAEKTWTLDEWDAILSFRRTLRPGDAGGSETERNRFLPLRFGDGEVEGLFDTAIIPDVRARTPEQIARLILDRLQLIRVDATAGREVAPSQGPTGRGRLGQTRPDGTGASGGKRRQSSLLNLGEFVGRSSDQEAIEAFFQGRANGTFVLAGEPGVGKSHLANAYGIQRHYDYPGGTWFIPFNADPGLGLAKLLEPIQGEPIADRAKRALECISELTLLVYDNVSAEAELLEWLPPPTLPAHILVTTTAREWPRRFATRTLARLSDEDGRLLVKAVGGDEVTEKLASALIERAAGLPVQLKADAAYADYELRHGRSPDLGGLAEEASVSFARAFSLLPEEGRWLLRVAALFNEAHVPEAQLRELTSSEKSWSERQFQKAMDHAVDRSLVQRIGDGFRIHGLIAAFLRESSEPELSPELEERHRANFVTAARDFAAAPADTTARAKFACFPETLECWVRVAGCWTVSELVRVGVALRQAGRFTSARPWFERAVTEAEKGDVDGRVDYASLGASLHHVGDCWSSMGRFEQARACFERAVAETERGDIHGRVDHESLGRSLSYVGDCWSSMGQFEQARAWFERAVVEKQKGDIHGRVDYESLGVSLHLVGHCWSSVGKFEQARAWYERAVVEKQKGDVHGRVDHASLGVSLHRVGTCWWSEGQFEQARAWLERAVVEKQKGDVHGRVDHESLGGSLHQVGNCWWSVGQFEQARAWFERAVAEAEKGDVHGRVDHASLGVSLHGVGYCWWSEGQFEQARPWFERAVAEKQKGDLHGRVDLASIELSRENLHRPTPGPKS